MNELCTTWPTANGPHTKCTTRASGQSDQDFLDTHGEEVVVDMAQNTPVP